MHLTFLGTGAATASPLPFCNCACCAAARREGGKNIRRRSSLLVGDELLIDLGPDTVQAAFRLGLDLRRVHTLLVTHAHADHFDPGHLCTRLRAYGCVAPAPLALVASPASLTRMSEALMREEPDARLDDPAGLAALSLTVRPCLPGDRFVCGRYTVTALASRHDPAVDSRLYVVDDGEKRLLYALDSPAFDEANWEALAALGTPLDCVVLDHTYGPHLRDLPRDDHMSAHDAARTAAALHVRGLLTPGAQIWASHLSHEGTPPHAEMSRIAERNGYRVAWDGMEIDV